MVAVAAVFTTTSLPLVFTIVMLLGALALLGTPPPSACTTRSEEDGCTLGSDELSTVVNLVV